jgi:hypothetical protein
MSNREYQSERYRSLREAKLCVECKQPSYRARCEPCYVEWHKARRRGDKENLDPMGKLAGTGPRCKCMLLLPCENCTPTVEQIATKGLGVSQ